MNRVKYLPIAIFTILLNANYSFGCVCDGPENPLEGYKQAKAVFSGQVTRAIKGKYSFTVDRVWKGDIKEKVILYDLWAETSCGIQMDLGERYVVFATYLQSTRKFFLIPIKRENVLIRDACNWTSRIAKAGDTLKALGEGRPPLLISSRK